MMVSVLLSALLMGFLGSWHCGVMCGPLSCNFRSAKSFASYHIGRLLSYLLLTFALYEGAGFFLRTDSRDLKLIASVVFAVLFVVFGILQMRTKRLKIIPDRFYFLLMKKIQPLWKRSPFVLGLLTVFLPCGWLYSFLMLSSQMPSATGALSLTAVFWLSSLPAFAAVNGFMHSLIRHSPVNYRKVAGVVLILAGLFSVGGHWVEILFL